MAEDRINEETYSLIFTSLKHPIRRSILRMLADKPLTYSEILETLNIDSGHLSYHLEALGDLAVHSNDGLYTLSSFGVAAVKLMGGVEEHTPLSSHRRFKPRRLFTKVYTIILALALLGASLHLVSYVTVISTTTTSTESMLYPLHPEIPLNVAAGETFNLTVAIEYQSSLGGRMFGVRGNPREYVFYIPPIEDTLTCWDEATIWLDSKFNLTTLFTTYPYEIELMFSNATQTNETITVVVQGSGFSVDPNEATDPSNLELELYTPDGTLLTETFYRSGINRIDASSSQPVQVTQPWNYTFKIANKGSSDWNGFLTINLQHQHFEKPCFYWGLVGLIIAIGYIALVTITSYTTRHTAGDRTTVTL
ncbi:MAG: hypothetical protein CW691_03330 [Candidatus Bathyarchaeum sp.]|nr:MAG: hypothetical protein CW691_03330 [Candidatus Bathyarchaeum sp.]